MGAAVLVMLVLAGCGGSGPAGRRSELPKPVPPAVAARRALRLSRRALREATPRQVASALARLLRIGRPVYCGGTRRRYAALTFDDGPGVHTGLALRILRRFRVPATFFLVGDVIPRFRRWPREEAKQGALGDHTLTHPLLTALPPAVIRSQIAGDKRVIESASNAPVLLFRPPYGGRNATVDAIANELGLVEVLWNDDSGDSLGADYAQIVRNVRAGLKPGSIVLMHENRGQTIRALRYYILPALHRAHLHLVTVPELLALDPPMRAQLDRGPSGCRLAGARTNGG